VKELASATTLSERMIRRQIDLGELRAARIGTRILVCADDVNDFLAKKMMV